MPKTCQMTKVTNKIFLSLLPSFFHTIMRTNISHNQRMCSQYRTWEGIKNFHQANEKLHMQGCICIFLQQKIEHPKLYYRYFITCRLGKKFPLLMFDVFVHVLSVCCQRFMENDSSKGTALKIITSGCRESITNFFYGLRATREQNTSTTA